MINGISHISLMVANLEAAESFYSELFGMTLIGRESLQDDGQWYTLPFDKTWQDAHNTGVILNMVALRKDKLVLALFQGKVIAVEPRYIGLSVDKDEINAIRSRLSSEIVLLNDQEDRLEIMDPYQIIWQIAVDPVFQTAGEFAGRWINL